MPPKATARLSGFSWPEYALFLLLVPAVLALVYLLPDAARSFFILDLQSPTLSTIFLSSYTHSSLSHLLGNLSWYLAIIFLAMRLEPDRRRFLRFSLLAFFALPFISHYLVSIILPSLKGTSQGFSAIVSAYLGYLLYVIYDYLKINYFPKMQFSFLYFLLSINFVIWSAVYGMWTIFFLMVFFSLALAYVNIEAILEVSRKLLRQNAKLERTNIRKRLFASFAAVLPFCFFMLAPLDIVSGGVLINILAHYLGYVFGVASGAALSWFCPANRKAHS
ncbi:MAG: hypothetical protein JW727_02335 [Candidatus Aenigmarchaeota archaeon]|nr:hypothetical protein [Candidatus Aenigmarchaeota archaeon]